MSGLLSNIESPPVAHPKKGDVIAAVATSIISSLPVFLVAGLALQVRDSLHFSVAALGFVVSLYYLSAAVSSVPLGRLAQAVGAARAMRAGCGLMGLLMLALAGCVRSFDALAIVMVLTGAVSAGLQPATNLFIVRRIPATHRGFALGIKQAAVPMAVLIGGFSVPVIALTIGWRWAFVAAAAAALAVSALLPRSHSTLAEYRARPSAAPIARSGVCKLVLLASGFTLGVAAASALSAFAVTAAVHAGLGKGSAGLLAGVGGFAAAATRVMVGAHADRGRQAPLIVAASMLSIGAAAYVVLSVSVFIAPWLLIPGAMLAFAAGWGWNGLFNLAVVRRYPAQAAQATGITGVGGRAGGVLGPLAFGLVATHFSYTAAWSLAAFAALAGALIIVAGRHMLDAENISPERG